MSENKDHIIDKTLLHDIASGNEEAFGKLVHQLYKRLFSFTVSLIRSETEADDVLQEAFLKIWLRRASLTDLENPSGWIFTIIANTAANHLRSKIRRELMERKFNSEAVVAEEIIGDIEAKFTQSLIDEAVAQLPEKRRVVFLLAKKERLCRKEIASRLNISENTVRNQLSEAVRFVHEYVQRKNHVLLPLLFVAECHMEIFFRYH